jgi:hypothetical protein
MKRATQFILVYLAIQYSLSPEKKAAAVLDAAENLTTVIYALASNSTLYGWKIWQKYFPHTMPLVHFADADLESFSLSCIYYNMAYHPFETGHVNQAQMFIRRGLKLI